MATVKEIRTAVEAASTRFDTVGRQKDGNVVCRRGFFYTHGQTAEALGERIVAELAAKGIETTVVEACDVWKNFRGGASIANQSHFRVVLKASA